MAAPVISSNPADIGPPRATAYGWLVFALCFGLLISDYMARQVLNAVFPLLKVQWQLSDTRLGLLAGTVPVIVGLLTLPLSIAADRFGRVRSLTAMALLWSLATLLCAAATSYFPMLLGRALVGVGEAAYGSVGIAVVISVFPARLRATLSAAFLAGSLFGQIIGVALGAGIAAAHGWRAAFVAIGLGGLVLALLCPLILREKRIAALAQTVPVQPALRPAIPLRTLYASRSVRLTYLAGGLQMFAVGALPAWLPSYLGRYHHLPLDRAGQVTALLLLACGTGMILCGGLSDRLSRYAPTRKIDLAIGYCLGSAALLTLALQLPPGTAQLVLLGCAMFLIAGTTGPAGAMVAGLTPPIVHGSAFAALTLAYNLLGLAPGPILTGRIADSVGLLHAFQLLPLASLAAALVFTALRRDYLTDLAAVTAG